MESEPQTVVRTHVKSRGKSPLPEKNLLRRIEHQAGQRVQHTTNELIRPRGECSIAHPGRGLALQVHDELRKDVCWLVGCLTSQQHASVSQGRICEDNFTCRHTEIEVADQTFYLTQSQYTDTGPTSPSADPITPDAWQGSHWSANF